MNIPGHLLEHLRALTDEQREDLLADLTEGLANEDVVAVIELLESRGRPAIATALEHRREARAGIARRGPAHTLRERGYKIDLAHDVAEQWDGRPLVEILLGAHITGPGDRSDRVGLRRRGPGVDVSAVAAQRGHRELRVISARDNLASRVRRR